MIDNSSEMQRAIGRIEGTQAQIIAKLDGMIVNHIAHENDDRRNFASLRSLIDTKLNEHTQTREAHLEAQDIKLDALKTEQDRARGAGWVIIGVLAAFASFLGFAVNAALGGHIKFQ